MAGFNDDQVKGLEAMRNRLQMQLNTISERPNASEDEPTYVLTKHKIDKADRILKEHYDSLRPVGDDGKLTEDAPSHLPIRSSGSFTDQPSSFFFEPSVEEVKHRLQTDPEFVKKHGLETWLAQDQPAHDVVVSGPMDPTTGSGVTFGVQQQRSNLDGLTSGSEDYGRIADEMWKERLEEAQKNGRSLTRYSKVKLGNDPGKYMLGGVENLATRWLALAASVGGDVMSAGTGRAMHARNVRDYQERVARGERFAIKPPDIDPEAMERANPALATIARIGAYALPMAPGNVATTALLDRLGYGAANFLGRAGLGAAAGGIVSAGEGAVRDVSQGVEQGLPIGDNLRQAANNLPWNAGAGAVLGGVAEGPVSLAKNFRQAVRESDSNVDLRALRNARGDTAIFGDYGSGYIAPPEIREDIRQAAVDRSQGTAADIAARRVAPKVQESLDNQLTGARQGIEAKNREYFTHPAYQSEESGQEAVDAVLELADRGWTTGAIDGLPQNVDPKKLARIGDALLGAAQRSKPFASRAKAEAEAATRGGRVIDGYVAAAMWPGDKINNKG